MANKYTYSRTITTIAGKETFSFEGGASFDEAKKEVDKGIRDRLLELKQLDPLRPPTGGPMHVPGPGTSSTPGGQG